MSTKKMKKTKVSFTIVHSDIVPKLINELSELRPPRNATYYYRSGVEAIVDNFSTTMDSTFYLGASVNILKQFKEIVEVEIDHKTDFIFASHNEVIRLLKEEIKFAKENFPDRIEQELENLQSQVEEKKKRILELQSQSRINSKKKTKKR